MIAENKTSFTNAKIYWLIGATLLIKLFLLRFAQTTDPDAVSRIFFSEAWKEHPVWISVSDWGPFHFYLVGFALIIFDNMVYTPAVLTILLSSITLLPFYYFTKREFNEKGAFVSTVFLVVCPILFRNSFLALSETPYLFFIALTMNLLSKGIRSEEKQYFILAGLSITFASGFRYDAWLLIALFELVLLMFRKWKASLLFLCAALLFPVTWMIQSYVETGDPIHGIRYNTLFTLGTMENNANLTLESYLRRIWFFPFSWMIALGPPAAFITIREIIFSCKKRDEHFYWALPFAIILLFFLGFAFRGTLLLQHRFTGTLVVLSLPFFGHYFKEASSNKNRNALIFGILTIGLSFAWNTYGVKLLPRLQDQSGEKIVQVIKKEIHPDSGLIIDFWNWENTYYIALHSGLPFDHIVILSGSKNSGIQRERIEKVLSEHHEGIILLKKSSALFLETRLDKNMLHFKRIEQRLVIRELFRNEELVVFNYSHPDVEYPSK